ncbi:AGE family epimerase/isomerase [Pseudobdellovibrio exovorus]|uniref:Mannose-6-phosphate isomerase n=1 Tax=Pseudobdellovibrio exovorus JSS TaxID=1184267 RepID=M4VAA0_9BACT|nr:AGE family epimerase/isomerase [Pseudobdellovibrio exovorus]AGH95395.1 hypothetical protein A11Q_1179 [Pseudobdellovibrio exovorus JSS]
MNSIANNNIQQNIPPNVQQNIQQAKQWLTQNVFPIWFERGYESSTGCFVESIALTGEPLSNLDRRAMVQARQIYAMTEAVRLNLFARDKATPIIRKNIQMLIQQYRLPSGGYAHSINSALQVSNSDVDLYTQAFVLFGLARAYELLQDEQLVIEAKKLLNYLQESRSTGNGGHTEIKAGKTLYQSNPHMHLFEAALAWVAVSRENCWRQLADDLFDLCTTKFIDAETGFLAEHYLEPWTPQRIDGHFIFEPGHHFEWAWLLSQYQQLTGVPTAQYSQPLYESAEKYGLTPDKKFAVDEVLSNTEVHKKSSRFWPQTERIKAAVDLGLTQSSENQTAYAQVADTAFVTLFRYFEGLQAGLWQDTLQEDGKFQNQPAKASSLYHIINALSEYILKRPQLG